MLRHCCSSKNWIAWSKKKTCLSSKKVTNEFINKIRAYESEKKLKNEQLKFQQDKETRLTEELERDRSQLNHVLYNIKRLTEEKEQEDTNLQTITVQLNDLKARVDELSLRQSAAKNELNGLTPVNKRHAAKPGLSNREESGDTSRSSNRHWNRKASGIWRIRLTKKKK